MKVTHRNDGHFMVRRVFYDVKTEKGLKMPPQDDETIQLMDFCKLASKFVALKPYGISYIVLLT